MSSMPITATSSGTRHAELGEAVQGAEGEQVVEAEDRVGHGVPPRRFARRRAARRAVPVAGRLDHLVVDIARPARRARGVAGEPQPRGLGDRRHLRPRWRRCDAGRARAGGSSRRGPRRRCRWRCGPSHPAWMRSPRHTIGTSTAGAGRSSSPRASGLKIDPVDEVVADAVERRRARARAAVGLVDEHRPAELFGGDDDALGDLGEVRRGEVGDGEGDHAGAPAAQAARRQVAAGSRGRRWPR